MSVAIIVPSIGTVVLRDDGSVTFTDRQRCTAIIDAEVVAAIGQLLAMRAQGAAA